MSWKKEGLRLFIGNCFVSMIVFAITIFCKHYSADDYAAIYNSKNGAMGVASSYRLPIAIIYYFVDNILGVNTTIYQSIFIVLLMFVLSFSITLMSYKVLKKLEHKDALTVVLVESGFFILFENAFLAEWLWFAGGALQWGASIFCATCAAILFADEKLNNKNRIFGALLLVIGVGSYQLCLAQFIYCFLILKGVERRGNIDKKLVVDTLKVSVYCIMSVLVNIILTKIAIYFGFAYENNRVLLNIASDENGFASQLTNSAKKIFIDGMGYFPKGLLVLVIMIVIGINVINIRLNDCEWNKLFAVLTISLSGVAVTWCAFWFRGDGYIVPRTFIGIFGMYTCFIILPLSYSNKRRKIDLLTTFISVAFMLVNMVVIEILSVDSAITRVLDEEYYQLVYEEILNYQDKTDIIVDKVSICYDMNPCKKYYDKIHIPVEGDVALSAKYKSWSWLNAMNFYLGTDYETIEMDPEIKEYFTSKDWEYLNLNEQMVFSGDVLYMCAY